MEKQILRKLRLNTACRLIAAKDNDFVYLHKLSEEACNLKSQYFKLTGKNVGAY